MAELLPGINIFSLLDADYAISDSDGIPLASDRAIHGLTRGIDWQYRNCPFKDSPSRTSVQGNPEGKPMSGLEYQRLASNYPAMLSVVESLRAASFPTDQALDLWQTHDLLRAMKYLPHYLVFRAVEPTAMERELPPALIVLSNAAAGSLAGLGSYIQHFPKSLQIPHHTPDVGQLIKAAEKDGHTVGNRTVCVAAPSLMEDFLSHVVNGGRSYPGRFDLSLHLKTEEEAARLSIFAAEVYFANLSIETFKEYDNNLAAVFPKVVTGRKITPEFRLVVADYPRACQKVIEEVNDRQLALNKALGRGLGEDIVSIPELKVPSLLKGRRL